MNPTRSRAYCLLTIIAIFALSPVSHMRAGPDPTDKTVEAAPDRDDRFQFAYETAINLGINNPNNYIINPQIFELRWQPWHAEQFFPHAVRVSSANGKSPRRRCRSSRGRNIIISGSAWARV